MVAGSRDHMITRSLDRWSLGRASQDHGIARSLDHWTHGRRITGSQDHRITGAMVAVSRDHRITRSLDRWLQDHKGLGQRAYTSGLAAVRGRAPEEDGTARRCAILPGLRGPGLPSLRGLGCARWLLGSGGHARGLGQRAYTSGLAVVRGRAPEEDVTARRCAILPGLRGPGVPSHRGHGCARRLLKAATSRGIWVNAPTQTA